MEDDPASLPRRGVKPREGCESGGIMMKRDGRGHSYCGARGEILGPSQDGLVRKRLPRTFSLIESESLRFEDDQIPS